MRCRLSAEFDFAGRAMEVEAKGSRGQGPGRGTSHVIGDTRSCNFFIEIPRVDIKGQLFSTGPLLFPLLDRHEVWEEDFRALFPLFAFLASSDMFPDRPLQRMASLLYRLQSSQT